MYSDTVRGFAEDVVARAGLKGVSRQALMAGLAVFVAVVALAAWRWMPGPAEAVIVEGEATVPLAAATTDDATSAEASTTVFVHVSGSVRHPGVYELADGSRLIDAVTAAGGLLSDASPGSVNLARLLTDGEQIAVPSEDEVRSGLANGTGESSPASKTSTGLIDINSADEALLDTLPGVGPSTADKIVAEREANGRFASVDDLARVPGIGPKKLEAMRDLVCVQ